MSIINKIIRRLKLHSLLAFYVFSAVWAIAMAMIVFFMPPVLAIALVQHGLLPAWAAMIFWGFGQYGAWHLMFGIMEISEWLYGKSWDLQREF